MSCISSVNNFFIGDKSSVLNILDNIVFWPIEKVKQKFGEIKNSKLRVFLELLSAPIMFALYCPILAIGASLIALAFCVQLIALTFAAAADGMISIYNCCRTTRK